MQNFKKLTCLFRKICIHKFRFIGVFKLHAGFVISGSGAGLIRLFPSCWSMTNLPHCFKFSRAFSLKTGYAQWLKRRALPLSQSVVMYVAQQWLLVYSMIQTCLFVFVALFCKLHKK